MHSLANPNTRMIRSFAQVDSHCSSVRDHHTHPIKGINQCSMECACIIFSLKIDSMSYSKVFHCGFNHGPSLFFPIVNENPQLMRIQRIINELCVFANADCQRKRGRNFHLIRPTKNVPNHHRVSLNAGHWNESQFTSKKRLQSVVGN